MLLLRIVDARLDLPRPIQRPRARLAKLLVASGPRRPGPRGPRRRAAGSFSGNRPLGKS